MQEKAFKILSIDGGGIRGILPARILCELEDELSRSGAQNERLYNYFDLICGTSTGGIIALGLALGMPAKEILDLYKKNADKIFKKGWLRNMGIFGPKYSAEYLSSLLENGFSKLSANGDTRLGHAKTRVCIPTYNAQLGKTQVYKTAHHEKLIRDYQIPAHHVALSSAAAPVFFPPHNFSYKNVDSDNPVHVSMNIDGGTIANNPTHIGLVEAHNTLGVPLNEIKVLSIGTGHSVFSESQLKRGFGLIYWGKKGRLIDLMFSAQSQNTDNMIKLLNNGVGEGEKPRFYYKRIQHFFQSGEEVGLDETNPNKLLQLETIALNCYKEHGAETYRQFLTEPKREFKPHKQISHG